MYLRFVMQGHVPQCRAEPGLFRATWRVEEHAGGLFSWVASEVEGELAWFNRHLAIPRTFARRFGRHGERGGVCWFRDTAREHIARARYFVWLLSEVGLPVREIRMQAPGPILWEDDHQIVALAGRDVPKVFR